MIHLLSLNLVCLNNNTLRRRQLICQWPFEEGQNVFGNKKYNNSDLISREDNAANIISEVQNDRADSVILKLLESIGNIFGSVLAEDNKSDISDLLSFCRPARPPLGIRLMLVCSLASYSVY